MLSIDNMLGDKPAILLDGATGTNLFEMGLQSGMAPELWNRDQPEKIKRLHQNFIAAGSDAILTNSFGGNARRLMLHQAQDDVHLLNVLAAKLAKECAKEAERDVWVFGSIGPTGDLFAPLGKLTAEDAENCFADQAAALDEGGIDAFWIETLSSIEEAEAAIRGVKRVSHKPICLAMSFDTAGRTMMGITPENLPSLLGNILPDIDAIGANCGLGPAELIESIMNIRHAHPNLMLIAKSNYGVPEFKNGVFYYHGTPEMMRQYAAHCLDLQVKIIGGCCGTTPEVIRQMRQAIDLYAPPEDTVETEARIKAFIEKNRASTPASTVPTDQQDSGRRSGKRSRGRSRRQV